MQAEAIANAVRVMEGSATKGGILRVDNDVNADIARLETRMLMTTIVVAGIVVAAVEYL